MCAFANRIAVDMDIVLKNFIVTQKKDETFLQVIFNIIKKSCRYKSEK